ncbi:MAG: prepilin-type N-terminal cleavage/methylation domain-containing protein [Thermodesulfovibrionales bacterium]
MERVISNKTGLSLVEVMIALVVFLIVFLALMQTALVSISSNMINVLRDEAVSIAEMRMNEARALPFTQTVDTLVGDSADLSLTATICPANFGTTGLRVSRNLRNISNFDFCTNREVNPLNTDNKQVSITVGWKFKGEDYTHNISTILRRQ